MDKILVVDDMVQNVQLISKFLISVGYDVIASTSGNDAIRKARLETPDLIILDLILPDISGFDVCKIVKENEETKNTFILIVTAMDSRQSKQRAFEVGADDFLLKPFDEEVLIAKVKSFMKMKHLRTTLYEQYSQLEEKNKQLEVQLKIARQVQRLFITEYNETIEDISFISKYMPALEIGGDFYDIIKVRDQYIYIFICDISGHGIAAALLTAMIKSIVQKHIIKALPPNDLLNRLNHDFIQTLSDDSTEIYACAYCIRIDYVHKTISYSNAGHALPIYVDTTANMVFPLEATGVPLGLMEDTQYTSNTLQYNEDDFIFLYTDGLSDSLYKENPEEFVTDLCKLLSQLQDINSYEKFLDAVLNYFYDNTRTKENDDISLILCAM